MSAVFVNHPCIIFMRTLGLCYSVGQVSIIELLVTIIIVAKHSHWLNLRDTIFHGSRQDCFFDSYILSCRCPGF